MDRHNKFAIKICVGLVKSARAAIRLSGCADLSPAQVAGWEPYVMGGAKW